MEMKRIMIMATAVALGVTAGAQSGVDAYNFSQSDLKGTARFMSMAGAFGALGGDISTLNQNPGGIGVYRSSDIGITVDFNFQSAKAEPTRGGSPLSVSQTKVYCNNFGYVGTVNLGNETMPFFNWGASYTRAASFDRHYKGAFPQLNGSLTNYVADYTTEMNWGESDLNQFDEGYNPYQDSRAPWLSVLFYNNFLINPTLKGYSGLYQLGSPGVAQTVGNGSFEVTEKGYVDEYSINFGGNIMNTVYWGIAFGITDLSYTSTAYYQEDFQNALIAKQNKENETDGTEIGSGGYGLKSWKHVTGTGFNFKAGIIVKPINELRLGLAVHTPTYYNLTQEGWAGVEYDFSSGIYDYNYSSFQAQTDEGYNDYFQWKLRTPWRMIASAAGVIGGKFILSADYEYRAYQDMKVKKGDGTTCDIIEGDIKTNYQASNTLRLGAEYRITPQLSVRAGYSYESSPVRTATANGTTFVATEGEDETETTPSFTLDNTTQYITCGLGYRYKWFYADAAFVHKHRSSTYYAYTPVGIGGAPTDAPSANITNDNNSLVLTIGFKF